MKIYTTTTDKKKIAETNLFFLREINDRLKVKQFDRKIDKSCTVLISSLTVDYCFESIKIIEHFYTKDDWKCKMIHFYKTSDGRFNCYAFKFTRV